MQCLDAHPVCSLPVSDGPLLSLGDAFAMRFHSWHGASEARYVFSVFAADSAVSDLGLPEFDACILLPVAHLARARRVLGIFVIERGSDRRHVLARVAGLGVDEWHVHLLAGDRRARFEAAADLRARHGDRRALSA